MKFFSAAALLSIIALATATEDVTVNPLPGNGTTPTSTVMTATKTATITTVIQTTITIGVPTVITTSKVPGMPTPTNGAADQNGPAKALVVFGGLAAVAQLL